MIFRELAIPGVWLLVPEKIGDERGFFARSWCHRELDEHGLESRVVQTNISRNDKAGTVRGMHFQRAPHEEVKFVRCTKGRIFDALVDVRPDSGSYLQHVDVELSEEDHVTLYIPQGFAHGFQTLTDDTEVFYMHSEYYHPESAAGLRWDDPALAIDWPIKSSPTVSDKDRSWPLLQGAE